MKSECVTFCSNLPSAFRRANVAVLLLRCLLVLLLRRSGANWLEECDSSAGVLH